MVTPLRLHFTKRDRQQPVDVRRIRSCTYVRMYVWMECILHYASRQNSTSHEYVTANDRNGEQVAPAFRLPRFSTRKTRNVAPKSDALVVWSPYEDKLIRNNVRITCSRVYCIELEFLMIICHVRAKQCLVLHAIRKMTRFVQTIQSSVISTMRSRNINVLLFPDRLVTRFVNWQETLSPR